MEMLYVNYMPKTQGEKPDFKIIKSLKKCMRYYNGNNNIISSPGYLSSKTYVHDFVDEFSKIIPSGNKIYIGYFKGMNKISNSAVLSLIDEHYIEMQKTGKFEKLNMKISNKVDHRKMIFIYGIKEKTSFNFQTDVLDINNQDKFLDSIIVNAILLGSSNQSYSTYYGGKNKQADKGEADILLFTSDREESLRDVMYVEGGVIFKEIISDKNKDPHGYLKDILKDFLASALI